MSLQNKSALHTRARTPTHARTHIHTYPTWLSFFFDAIPGSPWAVPRHHEEKGHTQAFTILNRTAIKKNPENKLQSGKGTKEKLDLRLCFNQEAATSRLVFPPDTQPHFGVLVHTRYSVLLASRMDINTPLYTRYLSPPIEKETKVKLSP
jgi:hypothetical protein